MQHIFIPNGKLKSLHSLTTFNQKLYTIHNVMKQRFVFIDRISATLYDPQIDVLKTFIYSGPDNPLTYYDCRLTNAPSLKMLKKMKRARLVNDLSLFKNGTNEHTRRISHQGYQSSYSVPMFDGEAFLGVVFFNSYQSHVFKKDTLFEFDLFAQLINALIVNKLQATRMLIGAFKSALNLVSYKDPETGNHLERMARYSRLIAQALARAGDERLTDEIIEHIYLFAPLHDIGKIGIPDNILLKPSRLDDTEWEIMQTHSAKGRIIIDTIAEQLGIASFEHMQLLRNISESHHETIDGKGYPNRLKNNEIALETQIVTVADIFDALTSRRPYKNAWPNEHAFNELNRLAGTKLNADCVNALRQSTEKVIEIQKKFQDETR